MATAMQHSQTVARTLASVGSTDRDVDVKVGFPLQKAPVPAHAPQMPQSLLHGLHSLLQGHGLSAGPCGNHKYRFTPGGKLCSAPRLHCLWLSRFGHAHSTVSTPL